MVQIALQKLQNITGCMEGWNSMESKCQILLLVTIFSFSLQGCANMYSYNEMQEIRDSEYEKGYEDGYEDACFDNIFLSDSTQELLDAEEYEAIDSLRKIYTNSAVFGNYVADVSNNIVHMADCKCVDDIYYQNMCLFTSIDRAIGAGYVECNLCISNSQTDS